MDLLDVHPVVQLDHHQATMGHLRDLLEQVVLVALDLLEIMAHHQPHLVTMVLQAQEDLEVEEVVALVGLDLLEIMDHHQPHLVTTVPQAQEDLEVLEAIMVIPELVETLVETLEVTHLEMEEIMEMEQAGAMQEETEMEEVEEMVDIKKR